MISIYHLKAFFLEKESFQTITQHDLYTTLIELLWFLGSDTDYETWQSHSDNKHDGCLLGEKEIFERLKKDSW